MIGWLGWLTVIPTNKNKIHEMIVQIREEVLYLLVRGVTLLFVRGGVFGGALLLIGCRALLLVFRFVRVLTRGRVGCGAMGFVMCLVFCFVFRFAVLLVAGMTLLTVYNIPADNCIAYSLKHIVFKLKKKKKKSD